jgi:hypothetical protein
MSYDEYPFVAIHVDGCGGEMFFLNYRPKGGDVARSAGIIYPDGKPIDRKRPVKCHACGKTSISLPQVEWIIPRDKINT